MPVLHLPMHQNVYVGRLVPGYKTCGWREALNGARDRLLLDMLISTAKRKAVDGLRTWDIRK